MKKTGIAIAVLLAAGAAATGGAWYTGTKLEGVLTESIKEGNAELAKYVPNESVRIELTSFERGFFTSQARYRIVLGEAKDEEPAQELLIVDRIEHGPFPLSRLSSFKLMPVMAASHAELEQNATVTPWFKVAGEGVAPLVVDSAIGYDRSASGTLKFAPIQYSEDDFKLSFSGLEVDFSGTEKAEKMKVSGRMDSLLMEGTGARSGRMEATGFSLDSDRTRGSAGLYLGESKAALEKLSFVFDDGMPVVLTDLRQHDRLGEEGTHLAGKVDYNVGMVTYGGKELGSSSMTWSIERFDTAAVKSLYELYNSYVLRLQVDGNLVDPTPEEQARMMSALQGLLAAKPVISLDNFSLKTANGESSFSLKLALANPESLELPPEELAKQLVSSLNARLSVAKPMISDVMGYKVLFEPELDPQAVATEAKMMAEMAGEMVTAMQLGKLDGDKIVSTLDYANGQVDFNGQVMPVEQFAGLLAMMAPPGLAGSPSLEQPYDEEEGEAPDTELYEEQDAGTQQ